jgi:heme-degrading monooxygenase HmoA
MIRVIIEREIAEGLEEFYQQAIVDMLGLLALSPGYLSGESLVDIHQPNRYVVITRWANEEAWNRWFHSARRQEMMDRINPFLLTDEKFTLLRQLVYSSPDQSA